MKNSYYIAISILIIAVSCQEQKEPNELESPITIESDYLEEEWDPCPFNFTYNFPLETKNLDAKFTVEIDDSISSSDYVFVNFVIYNEGPDTLKYSTYTCVGEAYQLNYNCDELIIEPLLMCNGSSPIIRIIPPNQSDSFQCEIKFLTTNRNLKVGICLPPADFENIRTENYTEFRNTILDTANYRYLWAPEVSELKKAYNN